MDSQNNLETNGILSINPLAELLVEIAQIQLNGSLRIVEATQKIVVYFDAGDVIFAVSNARRHRLFEKLLRENKISKEHLLAIPEFTNDLALKKFLLDNQVFDKKTVESFFSEQISEILTDALDLREGEWTFSPLVRIKGDIRFPVNMQKLLVEYARQLPAAAIARKFNNSHESFSIKSSAKFNVNLTPSESFVYSRFEKSVLTVGDIQNVSGLPEAETFQILYTLWLGGLLVRQNWNAAFSERKVAAILSARLALKKEEQSLPAILPSNETKVNNDAVAPPDKNQENAADEQQISLDEYLERIENARNHYQIFDLAPKAPVAEIKKAYFSFAKRFHPDLFHTETDTRLLQRIQSAFTQLAHAYDTLKNEKSREVYDFKIRKELAADGQSTTPSKNAQDNFDLHEQSAQATENFEQGYNYLMNQNYDAAIPFLARAAHLNQSNARYHAFYGKALSTDSRHRHKAETELQTAVKLEDKNAEYRIMLVEFYIRFNLLKRAEGELNRLLAIHPNNEQARRLLDTLSKK